MVKAAAVTTHAEVSFTAIDSPSLQFLPRQQEAPGWRLDDDPIVVPANRLQSYLDIHNSPVIAYGVVDVTAGNYTATGGNGFAVVEIFRFPDFVKAFGAYSMAKEGPARFVDLQNEAFIGKNVLHLWRGPFYVRVTGGGMPDANDALVKLAAFVGERMPLAPAKPAVLNFLPVQNRVANSERYSIAKGLGQTFLGNSFQAKFTVPGGVADGLIIPAADKNAAARILDAYRLTYVRNGKLTDTVANLGEDDFTAEDRFMGRSVAFRIDRFVIVFNGYTERQTLVDLAVATDQRILGSIRKQLVSADQQADSTSQPNDRNSPAWTQRR